jgi:hypothetical protein
VTEELYMKKFAVCTLQLIFQGNAAKMGEMCRTCTTAGGEYNTD